MNASLGRRAAAVLEQGRLRHTSGARGLAWLWQRYSDPQRPLRLPPATRVIGVGGATLGGAHKTPLVIEIARQLEQRFGADGVAVVSHHYRARGAKLIHVQPLDSAIDVGDEAVLASRRLDCAVYSGPDRQAAIDAAARSARYVVVDGLLQTRPERLDASLLAVDAHHPWGVSLCPPCGDLRASVERLLAACDFIVQVHTDRPGSQDVPTDGGCRRPCLDFFTAVSGAVEPISNRGVSFELLRKSRVGLLAAIARPERLVEALQRHGIEVTAFQLFADHAWPRAPRFLGDRPDVWLTTAKCATKLGSQFAGRPILVLEERCHLPASALDLLLNYAESQAHRRHAAN